jgi:hypothetical protein
LVLAKNKRTSKGVCTREEREIITGAIAIGCALQQLAARRAVDGQQTNKRGNETRCDQNQLAKEGKSSGKGELKKQSDVH